MAGEYKAMALTPHTPPRGPHTFDIVAYDGHDRPLLIVAIKRNGDVRDFNRLVDDTNAT
jgi:hypothetical protein